MALDRLSQITDSGISTTISFRSAGINVSGVVTATTFVGALTGNVNAQSLVVSGITTLGITTATNLTAQSLIVSGITTLGTVVVGGGTTQLIVTGNARITGILTVGTGSITLDGSTNIINVGTGVTLSSSGINVTGIVTVTSIVVSAGTTALPSISPSGDPNTGIFFPSADTIAASTGGTSRLSIDASGNVAVDTNTLYVDAVNNRVAIGTTAPAGELDVRGLNSGNLYVGRKNNSGASSEPGNINFSGPNASGNARVWGKINSIIDTATEGSEAANLAFLLQKAGNLSEVARLDGSGRLLVGTTSTSADDVKLVVEVASGATGPTSGTAPKGIAISHPGGDGSYGGLWFSNTFGGDQGISGIAGFRSSNYETELRFYTNNTSSARSFTEQMRLDNSGNLKFNSGYGSVATAYGCRAWVNFNGTGTVAIRGSGNVSSITDNGTGDYTVNFTTAMVDANYAVGGSCEMGGVVTEIFVPITYNSGSTRIVTQNASTVTDATIVSAIILR